MPNFVSKHQLLAAFALLLALPVTHQSAMAILLFLPFVAVLILVAGFLFGRFGFVAATTFSLLVVGGTALRLLSLS